MLAGKRLSLIEHNPKVQPVILSSTSYLLRADEFAIEFPGVERIGNGGQTCRHICLHQKCETFTEGELCEGLAVQARRLRRRAARPRRPVPRRRKVGGSGVTVGV